MENEPAQSETEIEALARMVKEGFERMDAGFEHANARIDHLDTRALSLEKGVQGLNYKVDQLAAKLDQHGQETKDGADAIRRIVGGMSQTLSDHEERINALERE